MIIIEATGPLALIEDLGRSGYARVGVPPSGAADRGALRAANRLVGNPEGDAAIEVLLGGLQIRLDRPAWVAVAGAETSMMINGRADGSHHPLHLGAGDRLRIAPPRSGLRSYLAVRGGIAVPQVLGSRSSDLLSDLGPAALRPGDRLPIGRASLPLPQVDVVPPPIFRQPLDVTITPGPRAGWFTERALADLGGQLWRVSDKSDRTAVRLQGIPLTRRITDELPSEAIIRGAVQVPPSGQPLIFGSNHPVTGGYPVVAVVPDADGDRVAQLRPGDGLRFRWRRNP